MTQDEQDFYIREWKGLLDFGASMAMAPTVGRPELPLEERIRRFNEARRYEAEIKLPSIVRIARLMNEEDWRGDRA